MSIFIQLANDAGVISCLRIMPGDMQCVLVYRITVFAEVLIISQTQMFEANPETEGAMYVSVILGSDKTTVSVATGNVEYYSVYLSIGNLHNPAWCGYCNGVVPIAFLAIPKCRFLVHEDSAQVQTLP